MGVEEVAVEDPVVEEAGLEEVGVTLLPVSTSYSHFLPQPFNS